MICPPNLSNLNPFLPCKPLLHTHTPTPAHTRLHTHTRTRLYTQAESLHTKEIFSCREGVPSEGATLNWDWGEGGGLRRNGWLTLGLPWQSPLFPSPPTLCLFFISRLIVGRGVSVCVLVTVMEWGRCNKAYDFGLLSVAPVEQTLPPRGCAVRKYVYKGPVNIVLYFLEIIYKPATVFPFPRVLHVCRQKHERTQRQ